MLPGIRQELLQLHGFLKHEDTAAEIVVRSRIAHLHDNLRRLEAEACTVSLEVLQGLLNAANAADTSHLKAARAAVEHAISVRAQLAAEVARANPQIAEAARVNPAPLPPAPPAPQNPPPAPAA